MHHTTLLAFYAQIVIRPIPLEVSRVHNDLITQSYQFICLDIECGIKSTLGKHSLFRIT